MLAETISRRSVLKGGGALVVSFSLAGPLTAAFSKGAEAKPVALDEVGTFLAIGRDGTVTVYTGKVDLGTGVRIALMQMAAEELDVPVKSINLIEGDTDLCPDQGPTWASLTIQVAGVQIRQAAATARKAMLEMAAKRMGVPAASLSVENGVVKGGGKQISWGDLVDGKAIEMKVDKNATPKDPKTHKLVGQSFQRPDIPGKVTGKHIYMQDLRVPGMLHARMVMPPALGAKLQGVDEGAVKNIPGVVQVVRKGDFLAVVAETEWAAIKAARQIKATWSAWSGLPDQAKLYEHVRTTKIAKDETEGKVGDSKAALAAAKRKFSATYDFAIQLHGSMGPSCAVAQMKDGRMTVWTASQATHWLRGEVAGMLGLAKDKVRCVYHDGAGCYGRNGHEDAAAQAALIASLMPGKAIRVQWSRADEHGWEPNGPPTLIDMRAGLDAQGTVVAWEFEGWMPKQTSLDPVENLAMTLSGIPQKAVLNPGRIQNNAVAGYNIPNKVAILHRLDSTPFRPSWIRSPGRMQNTYAIEAFMDELAAAAGWDAVEYRLRHLKDERGAAVLKAAASRAGWDSRPSPNKKAGGQTMKGRGIAYARYETRTYIACVAEVEVDRASGKIRVTRMTVGHDCGQIINPDGLINQIEGQVIQTTSRSLVEEVKFDRSHITSRDWESYPILTFPDAPTVDVVTINRPDQPPWGAGEMAAIVVPPVITNAVFDATGLRLRSIPFTPAKVKAAFGSRQT